MIFIEQDAKRLLMERLDKCLKIHADMLDAQNIGSIYELQGFSELHYYLKAEHEFTPAEVEALLSFQDPLDVARWCWEENTHAHSFPICELLEEIQADRKFPKELNSVYTRSGQNSTPNSNATNLHSSQKRCCSFCISSSNASPTFQVQKSIFHQMTKPIQVTVILPLLLAISFSRNDDIHSSISGISNDLIGVIPTIGQ